MVQITYTLRLDMRDTGIVNTSLRLKQGDSGMKIAVNVFNGGVSAFDSSTTPKIVFRRPDGASVMADMTVESSLYSYTLVGNELQVPGKELIDIKFPIGAEGRESTMSCSIEVVPDTITPNTHGSGIYDNDLAVLVEEATEAAETVQEVVGDSEAWANGERNGVPVGPEDPAYHNNSKYWSEQANPTALANLTDVDVDGVVNGDVLQYNSSTQKWEGKSISSGTNEIIAPVEGATSLHAYVVGEQLIYNDTLYKVIAPIAVNDALVVDTNIEVSNKTVIEQVEDLDASKMSYAVNTKLGVHNRIPVSSIFASGTVNGLTYTVNSNDTVKINGTITAGQTFAHKDCSVTFTLPAGTYSFADGLANGTSANCGIVLRKTNSSGDLLVSTANTAHNGTFSISSDIVVWARIYADSSFGTFSNVILYPLLKVIEDTDPTFAPYAMTNRELTREVVTTPSISGATYTWGQATRIGRLACLQLNFTLNSNLEGNGGQTTITITNIPKFIYQLSMMVLVNNIYLVEIICIDTNAGTFKVVNPGSTAVPSGSSVRLAITYMCRL